MNQYIHSAFMRLDKNDFIKGLVMACITPILLYLANALGVPGFMFSSLDAGFLIKMGIAAGLSYIVKNSLTDSKGNVLGMVGGSK